MKGDFSRVTFDPRNHYSQVLLQQGRVTLDADPNEQGAILLHQLRTMARDLFGPYGGPVDNPGFELTLAAGNGEARTLLVGPGRYYVEGILCESEGCDYTDQPHLRPAAAGKNCPGDPLRAWLDSREGGDGARFWVYLDVWERHVTAVEHPWLREAALGGPDTCSRRQVVWQVRALAADAVRETLADRIKQANQRYKDSKDELERLRLQRWIEQLQRSIDQMDKDPAGACAAPLDALRRLDLPRLAARIDPGKRLEDPCVTSPESGYRGVENHLYRVEIHRGGEGGAQPTFKWSRDNGSVLASWLSATGSRIRVGSVRGFAPGAWVELGAEEDELLGRPGRLYRILGVEGDELTLEGTPAWTGAPGARARRWDQVERGDVVLDEGAVPVPDGKAAKADWIDLEDGVQVHFAPGGEYRCGDYWLIPARVATGGIAWRDDGDGQPLPLPPMGIEHHYAPLGWVGDGDDGSAAVTRACTCTVYPTSTCGILGDRVRDRGDIVERDRPVPAPAPAPPPPAREKPVAPGAGKADAGRVVDAARPATRTVKKPAPKPPKP